jgi:hypothetical protein
MAGECQNFKNYTRKSDSTKGKGKEDDNNKDQEDQGDKGFQKSKGVVNVLFARVLSSKSKQQEKLALQSIMVAKPATPKYLNWSEYPIQFSCKDQWTSVDNAEHYPLVLDPTIAGMIVTKVLIDGGAGLNIIFANTLRKISLDFVGLLTPTDVPFYEIVPGKAAMPLGQITLPVTFRTPDNYHTEFINFEVANFESSYHTIFGRPTLAKFMAVLHFLYLLLKMPGPNGILSLRGNLKCFYDCDAQAISLLPRFRQI